MYRDYRWGREAPGRDTSPLEGVTTWRWEGRRWQREGGSRWREWPDDLRGRERDRSQERPLEERARADQDRGGESFLLRRRECPREEYEWAARDGRLGRWVWQGWALDPQLDVCRWEACQSQMGSRVRGADWEPGC